MRALAFVVVLGVALLGGAGIAAASGRKPPASSDAVPDAELLLLLDLLRDADLAKQRELYPKLSLFERMKLLEQLNRLEWETEAATSRKGGEKR